MDHNLLTVDIGQLTQESLSKVSFDAVYWDLYTINCRIDYFEVRDFGDLCYYFEIVSLQRRHATFRI